jgi:voltage-gated potassium channel
MLERPDGRPELERRRERAQRVADRLELPMLVLAVAWLGLLVWEFVYGASRLLEALGIAIWVVFILAFALELTLAPRKLEYLKHNWLTVLSLLLPALRVFRVFRVLRAVRSIRLVRVFGSINRGMRSLGAALGRRGFGYVVALSLFVLAAGSAGMYGFERDATRGLDSYGDALWWTAMIMTTMGSDTWPTTLEGRVLCVALALYAFAIFGYVTATLAAWFIDREPARGGTESAADLRAELHELRAAVDRLNDRIR